MVARTALGGALGGLAGAVAMALAARVEQRLTGRPDSYVPAHTLAHVLGLPRPDADSPLRNAAMHYATGATVGVLRGVLADSGLRGARAALLFTPVRLTVDQVLENRTGVGAPPWTWPRDELVIDVTHKAIFALAAGAVADALVPPAPGSALVRRRGRPLRRSGDA